MVSHRSSSYSFPSPLETTLTVTVPTAHNHYAHPGSSTALNADIISSVSTLLPSSQQPSDSQSSHQSPAAVSPLRPPSPPSPSSRAYLDSPPLASPTVHLLPGPLDVRNSTPARRDASRSVQKVVLARLGILAAIFGTWLFVLWHMARTLLPEGDGEIRFPKGFEDLKSQSGLLQAYSDAHFYPVLTLFTCVYVFKQTFSVPGAVLSNILGGVLYGFWAFPLVSVLTAVGSTFCYLISRVVLGELIVERFARNNLGYLRRRVDVNRENGNLVYFLLFLRLFPFSPNWFLNVASPFVGVPLAPFFLSILFGLMPYNYICVQAAATLAQMNSFRDILSLSVLFKLVSVSAIALVPALYGRQISDWVKGRRRRTLSGTGMGVGEKGAGVML
ncbi:Transmembrane protein 41A [Thoreauomyces humboldtii]|nr:Transmembrane protein 41A [Thoreauomyces humboldtii]